MVLEFIIMQMVLSKKDNGLKIVYKELLKKNGRLIYFIIEINLIIKENTSMEWNMEMEFLYGMINLNM